MRVGRDRTVAVVTVATLTCLLLLAANVSMTELGGDGNAADVIKTIRAILVPLSLVLFAIVTITFIISLLSRKKKGGMANEAPSRKNSPWAFLLLGGFILVMAILAGGSPAPLQSSDDNGTTIPTPPSDGSGSTAPSSSDLFVAIVFLAILLISLFLLYRIIRGRSSTPNNGAKAALLDESYTDAIAMSTGDDLRDAIIRAYEGLLELIRSRMEGERMLTPKELAAISITQFNWPRSEVEELTDLFEQARYSDHVMGDSERERALRCIERIQASARGEENAR